MKRQYLFLISLSVISAACTSHDSTSASVSDRGLRLDWTPSNSTVCAQSADDGDEFNLLEDGCSTAPDSFVDQRALFQYSYKPTILRSDTVSRFVVTYEYRYAQTGNPDQRRFGIRRVGKAVQSPIFQGTVQSVGFTLIWIKEMSGSKFVTYTITCSTPGLTGTACWNSAATVSQAIGHHMERVVCIDDQADTTFSNASALCSPPRWDDINGQNPNWLPIAMFISSSSLAEIPLSASVTFTATSTDPDPDTLIHNWKVISATGAVVANGQGQTFSHTFGTTGEFRVRLVTEDQNGGMDVSSATARVNLTPPPPGPTVSVVGNGYVHALQECSWTASTSGGTPPYSYAWYRRPQGGTDSLVHTGTNSVSWWITDTTSRNYYLTASVVDSLSRTAQATKSVKVAAPGAECSQ